MSTPFQITRRVEFGDTDMAGIMHFANFFRFMEVAETAFLRAKGISVMWTANGERLAFPRVSASCDYSKPAKFEDELTIAVSVEKIGRRSVTYRFDFTRGADAIAVGRTTAVYCRTNAAHQMESQDIPESLRETLLT
jgi:YbgC/YbaW family acyl-CoA thioester hydrolase